MVLPPREWLYNNVMSRQGCMRYVGYAEFLMKHRMWRKKDVTTVQCEWSYAVPHNEARHIKTKEPEWLVKSPCMLPLCHPFTAAVAGPTGCGKTAWVLLLIDNVREKIEPVPSRIWYYYGEHQPALSTCSFRGRSTTTRWWSVRRSRAYNNRRRWSYVRRESAGCRHFLRKFLISQYQHDIYHSKLIRQKQVCKNH